MLKCGVSLGFGVGLFIFPAQALGGAWTLPDGRGQVIVTLAPSAATKAFRGRVLVPTPRYGKTELQGLIEYGLTDRFTLILAPSLQHVEIGAPVGAQRMGLGHTEIGGRYRLWQNDSWVLSAQATGRIPGTRSATNPAAAGYADFETDLRALLGHSFRLGNVPAFIDLQAAQRFFSSGSPHEFRADFTFGLYPSPRWLLLAQSFNVFSEGDGGPLFPSYEYYKVQLSGVYAITPKLAVQAGGFSTYRGRNTLQENGGIIGLWYRY